MPPIEKVRGALNFLRTFIAERPTGGALTTLEKQLPEAYRGLNIAQPGAGGGDPLHLALGDLTRRGFLRQAGVNSFSSLSRNALGPYANFLGKSLLDSKGFQMRPVFEHDWLNDLPESALYGEFPTGLSSSEGATHLGLYNAGRGRVAVSPRGEWSNGEPWGFLRRYEDNDILAEYLRAMRAGAE